jgi:hypothetical protein
VAVLEILIDVRQRAESGCQRIADVFVLVRAAFEDVFPGELSRRPPCA